MSKKVAKAKKLTSEEKIEEALKSNAEINELKIQRNMGVVTPEVLEMCKQHVDQMLEVAKKRSSRKPESLWSRKPEELEEAAAQVKNDQEMLVNVTMFTDMYEEVLAWNKLIRAKKLDMNVTSRHREADIAFFHKKVVELQRKKNLSSAIHALIYEYGHHKASER